VNLLGKGLVTVLLLVLLGVAGAGVAMLVERETGTTARARVTRCDEQGAGRFQSTDCTGTWVADGRVVVGPVQGAVADDVGTTIDVTPEGDHATSRSLTLPLLLIALGLGPLAAFGVLAGRARHRRRRAAAT
jgi:hypothetical protein